MDEDSKYEEMVPMPQALNRDSMSTARQSRNKGASLVVHTMGFDCHSRRAQAGANIQLQRGSTQRDYEQGTSAAHESGGSPIVRGICFASLRLVRGRRKPTVLFRRDRCRLRPRTRGSSPV
jgi:hypothetical protein